MGSFSTMVVGQVVSNAVHAKISLVCAWIVLDCENLGNPGRCGSGKNLRAA